MAVRNHSLPFFRVVAIPLRWNTVSAEDGGEGSRYKLPWPGGTVEGRSTVPAFGGPEHNAACRCSLYLYKLQITDDITPSFHGNHVVRLCP